MAGFFFGFFSSNPFFFFYPQFTKGLDNNDLSNMNPPPLFPPAERVFCWILMLYTPLSHNQSSQFFCLCFCFFLPFFLPPLPFSFTIYVTYVYVRQLYPHRVIIDTKLTISDLFTTLLLPSVPPCCPCLRVCVYVLPLC